jgi:glutamate formiminotransferase / 5-formyltetrahydrofolate cyclo-ligase
MSLSNKIVECVPNFSEGRDHVIMEKIIDCFRGKEGVKLLDYSNDSDHNRMVITAIGNPEAIKSVMVAAIGTALRFIDITRHKGQHPRIGAADVVPFIPVRNMTMEETILLAREMAQEVASRFNLPVFLYEKSASSIHRENLADVRKGQFEGLAEKMTNDLWKPDYGPSTPHPTAGAIVIGARNYLVAYNVNLHTEKLEIAQAIAKKVRNIGGGLHFCKAMGIYLKDRKMAQVSMNLTDYSKTSVYQAFEMVKMEAARYGVSVAGSEVIGLLPLGVLVDTANYYLGIENFTIDRVLEYRMLE